jgi:hypothetical protein
MYTIIYLFCQTKRLIWKDKLLEEIMCPSDFSEHPLCPSS